MFPCVGRKVLLGWQTTVREEWQEKNALADKMADFLAVKHAFQNWRLVCTYVTVIFLSSLNVYHKKKIFSI